jgi:hypothetical protein
VLTIVASNAPQAANMLPKFVEEDSDLPEPLNTAAKQEKRAKTLAAAHTGKKVHRVQAPDVQGYFSRTRIVKLVGADKIVIQFRIQPLEIECCATARQLFGNVVPEITELQDEELQAFGMRTYAMFSMPGQCWVRLPPSKPETRISVARSLNTILGRGLVDGQSAEVVDDYILPCLTDFLQRLDDTTKSLQPHVERLIAASAGLKKLPLHFSHHDLNEMNVLISDDHTVTGIVDWECARALPFGMGLHRIADTIVAENCRGCIEIPSSSMVAEKAFWNAILNDDPEAVLENLEDVQDALHTGALMFAIAEGHVNGCTDFLAGILTYRMPQIRGDSDPFAEQHMPK